MKLTSRARRERRKMRRAKHRRGWLNFDVTELAIRELGHLGFYNGGCDIYYSSTIAPNGTRRPRMMVKYEAE